MTSQSRLGRAGLGVALVVAGAVTAFAGARREAGTATCAPSAATGAAATPRSNCCFTNPAYGGICVVSPQKDETCATILAYLNDPQSQGKTYCHNTNLRGGWAQVACSPAPTPSGGR
jgi:hypothetical protein